MNKKNADWRLSFGPIISPIESLVGDQRPPSVSHKLRDLRVHAFLNNILLLLSYGRSSVERLFCYEMKQTAAELVF
jgi:hypothetical protein